MNSKLVRSKKTIPYLTNQNSAYILTAYPIHPRPSSLQLSLLVLKSSLTSFTIHPLPSWASFSGRTRSCLPSQVTKTKANKKVQ